MYLEERVAQLEIEVKALKQMAGITRDVIPPDYAHILRIKARVAMAFQLPPESLNRTMPPTHKKFPSRPQRLVWPRQIAMWLCVQLLPSMEYDVIGALFGGYAHGLVSHAINKVKNVMDTEKGTRKFIEDLATELQAKISEHQPDLIA